MAETEEFQNKIKIPVSKSVSDALSAPRCLDMNIEPAEKLKLALPSGGSLSAISDMGKAIPNDCSMTFSLMLQLGPVMASLDCILKILGLLKPLSDAVTSPPPTPGVIKDIIDAVSDLAPCFLMLTPGGMLPFVRDLICLIIKMLNCLLGQLKTLVDIMGGISLQLEAAEKQNNEDKINSLQCAQENAAAQAASLLQGIEPISVILDLAAPFMSIAGVGAIEFPAITAESNLESINNAISSLEDVVVTLQDIVNSLGGC